MFKANQYLFLIPPAVNGIAASTDIRILLTYDVVTLDTKLDGGKSVIEAKSVVSLPNETLKGGSAYKYVFTIGLEGVKVSADVENWDADVNVVDAALTEDAIKDAITAFSTIKGKYICLYEILCSCDGYGRLSNYVKLVRYDYHSISQLMIVLHWTSVMLQELVVVIR